MSAPQPVLSSDRDIQNMIYNKWGPRILENGKFYIFKGQKHAIESTWKDVNDLMNRLRELEIFEFRISLPEQRTELLNKKFEFLTKDIPPDWKLVCCGVISGLGIIVFVVSKMSTLASL